MESLVSNLVNFFLLTSALAIVALMIRTMMHKRLNLSIMMLIWMVVLFRMIVPFTFNSPIHLSDIVERQENSRVLDTSTISKDAVSPILTETDINNIAINQTQTANIQTQAKVNTHEIQEKTKRERLLTSLKALDYIKIALWAWVIGVLVSFTMHMIKLVIFRFRIKPYMKIVKQPKILYRNQRRIRLSRMVMLYECACIDAPFTVGFFRPKVIIPQGMISKISSEKLDMILTHELCHIKRADLLKAYLWLIAKSIHWFNPFVYIAYNAYLDDMESLCDSTVISYFNADNAEVIYSEALVDVVKLAKFSNEPCALISFCKDKTKLRKRVIDMVKPNKKSKLVGAISLVLMLIAVLGCFTTACLNAEEEEVADKPDTEIVEVKAKTIETDTEEEPELAQNKTITVDRVGTEERALAIAEKLDFCNADSFEYDEFIDYWVPGVHMIKANIGETWGWYMIYDVNGELREYTFYPENIEETNHISKAEAMEVIESSVKDIYGDVEITENDFIENEVDIYDSIRMQYVFTGSIYKESEGSTRELEVIVDQFGNLNRMSALYDPIYAMNISQETIDFVLGFARTDSKEIRLNQQEVEFGEKQYYFSLDDRSTHVFISASDNSLLRYSVRSDENGNLPNYQINEDESIKIAERYALKYFKSLSKIIWESFEVNEKKGYLRGRFEKENQFYTISVTLLSDESLGAIGIEKVIDFDAMEKISMEQAEEKAREMILDECPFAKDSLKLISSEESEDPNTPNQYIFNFEYKSDNPTIRNYPFNGMAGVNKYSGEFGTMRVDPIIEEMDLLSKEEAIRIAKEYSGSQVDPETQEPIDINKLKYRDDSFLTGPVLVYQIDFDYEGGEHGYGCVLLPDSGEIDGFGF